MPPDTTSAPCSTATRPVKPLFAELNVRLPAPFLVKPPAYPTSLLSAIGMATVFPFVSSTAPSAVSVAFAAPTEEMKSPVLLSAHRTVPPSNSSSQ